MARRLGWSPEAIEDIESIADYIGRDSQWYAKTVTTRIIEAAETIPAFPEIGRIVPEIGKTSIRELFAYSYRIIYRIEPEQILIAAVIHGSRLLQPFEQHIKGGQAGK